MKPLPTLSSTLVLLAAPLAAQCELAVLTDRLGDHPHNEQGRALAVSDDGERLLVGAPGTGDDAGAVYVYERVASTWVETQVVTQGSSGDRFGTSVAFLSSGDPSRFFVGAPSGLGQFGIVYEYEDSGGGVYSFESSIPNPGSLVPGDAFGQSVAATSDVLVVGAPGVSATVHGGVGAVYLFEELGGLWASLGQLDPSPLAAGSADAFGHAVAAVEILGLDSIVFAADPKYDPPGKTNVGAVFSFARDGAPIDATDFTAASGTRLGESLVGYPSGAVGFTVAVGAGREDVGGLTNSGRVRVYSPEISLGFEQPVVLEPSQGMPELRFGSSLALTDGRLVVGAAAAAGRVWVYEGGGVSWSETALLAPDVPDPGGSAFGAGLATGGAFAFVGAPLDDVLDADSGATWVFEKGMTGWLEEEKLAGGEENDFAEQGERVALSGGLAAVSENRFDELVHLFEIDGTSWTELPPLVASQVGDVQFADSIGIDGDRIVVGATKGDGAEAETGCAFVFERAGSTWQETAVLFATDGQGPAGLDPADRFGKSLALEESRLVVGAHQDDSGAFAGGSVCVFEESGGLWTEVGELLASDAEPFDFFGWSVALDGDWVLAGAKQEGSQNEGAAYVFRELVPGVWVEDAKLVGSQSGSDSEFGTAVAIEGNVAVVGAPFDAPVGGGGGAVYVFERIGGTWVETGLLANPAADRFGWSASIDEGRVAIASDDEVHVFERPKASWVEIQTIAPGEFVDDVALDGDLVLIGASKLDTGGENSGGAFVNSISGQGFHSLEGLPPSISVSGGGSHYLALNTCAELAGQVYWVWGSANGTTPPFPVGGGLAVPVNVLGAGGGIDAYWDYTVKQPNNGVLEETLSLLDGSGDSVARLNVPPGSSAGLAGLTLNHAYMVLEGFDVTFVSDAAAVALVP